MVAADQHFSQNLIVGLPNFKKDRFQNNKKNLVSQNRFHFKHNFVFDYLLHKSMSKNGIDRLIDSFAPFFIQNSNFSRPIF